MREKILNLKNSLWYLLLSVAVGGIIFAIDAPEKWEKLKLMVHPYEQTYKNLEKVKIGINSIYVDRLFGKPIYVNNSVSNGIKYILRYYEQDDFNLDLICSEDNNVVGYAVITKKKDFNPEFPLYAADTNAGLKDSRLGKFRLSEFNREPGFINLDSVDRYFCYKETYYFGKPGHYNTYFVGYSPYGYKFIGDDKVEKLQKMRDEDKSENVNKNKAVLEWRTDVIPNYFFVINETEPIFEACKNGEWIP